MFQEFSWGQFLLFSALLSFLWYLLVALLCYRPELNALLKGSPVSSSVDQNVTGRLDDGRKGSEKGHGQSAGETGRSLMGGSRLPPGVGMLSSSELTFSPREDGERYEQIGLVADVLEELKILFAELAESGGGKPEFFAKLERVSQRYGPLAGHPSIGRINGFIRDAALFPISQAELDELWY